MSAFPDVRAFEEPEELVRELELVLRRAPLAGTRDRLVKEVREWASLTGLDPDAADVLDHYNAAAEAAPGEVTAELEHVAASSLGREALISLLARAGTSDESRLIILDALAGQIGAAESGTLARANTGQRPQVLGRALEVLAGTGSAEALFALRKVFGLRTDAHGAHAVELASQLAPHVPEAAAVQAILAGEALPLNISDLDARNLLYAALSLSPAEQDNLSAEPDGDKLVEQAATRAQQLEAKLRAVSKAGSLGTYQSRLRDQLHDFVLVTQLPTDAELHKRARENLFRREDISDLEALIEHLPGEVLGEYVERSLTKANRRGKREDRTLFAVRLVRERGPAMRGRFRELLSELLDEPEEELRFEAARALARDQTELEPKLRSQLQAAYDGLERGRQAQLARELRLEGQTTSLEGFLTWVRSAPEGEIVPRAEALLQRWWASTDASPDDARDLLDAFVALSSRLDSEEAERLGSELAKVTANWLRAHTTKAAPRALLESELFRNTVLRHFVLFAEALRAEQARTLLVETLSPLESTPAEHIAAAAAIELDMDIQDRLVVPVLAQALRASRTGPARAFPGLRTGAQRSLLQSALVAAAGIRGDVATLEQAIAQGATEALLSQRETLSKALREAETAAEGNDRLRQLLTDIRATLIGEAEDLTDPSDATPSGVRQWRTKAAGNYPSAVSVRQDGASPLEPLTTMGEDPDALARLLSELDKRVHSTRVAPVAERRYYEQDLRAVVAAGVDSGVIRATAEDDAHPVAVALRRGQPALRALVAEQLTGSGPDDSAGQDLENALRADDRQALALLGALADRLSAGAARNIVEKVLDADLPRAWALASQLLDLDARNLHELRRTAREQEARLAGQVAGKLELPFQVIENLLFSYFRLRQQLSDAGWRRVEDVLGKRLDRSRLQPDHHQVINDDGTSDVFEVKSLGIEVAGQPVSKAIVEPVIE